MSDAASAAPAISVSPSSLAFGEVTTGNSGTATVRVSNTGTASLSITGITFDGTDASRFSASPTTATVAAGNYRDITVTYTPGVAGSHSATMKIAHNDTATGSPTSVSLSGTGTADYSTATWLGNSYIVFNGTWYNGSNGDAGKSAFNGHDFGAQTAITLGGQAQTYGDNSASGHIVEMQYSVYPSTGSASTWNKADMVWFDYANNNNWFRTGTAYNEATVDIANLAAGSYKLNVYFQQQTGASSWIYDSNSGNNFIADFSVSATLSTSVGSLTGFTATYPSAGGAKTFTVTGTHLTGNLTVSAPTGYEVSKTSGTSGFANSVTLNRDGNNKVTTQTVWVRLKANASVGTHNGVNVSVSGGSATTVNVGLTGTVSAGTPVITKGDVTATATTATVPATINAKGAVTTVSFVYGTTESYGTTGTVTGGDVSGHANQVGAAQTAREVSVDLSNLKANTTYYYQWTAANGTSATQTGSFTTPCMSAGPVVTPTPGNGTATFTWADVGAVEYLLSIWTGSGGYEQVTGSATVADGTYVIVNTGDTAMMSSLSGSIYTKEDATISSGVLSTAVTDAQLWVIENHSTYYTIKNKLSGKYVTCAADSNSAGEGTDPTAAAAKWTLTMSSGTLTAQSQNYTARYLQYNTTSPRFVAYKNSGQNLHLYKKNGSYVTGGAGGTAGTVGVTIHDLAVSSPVTVAGLTPLTAYNWSLTAVGGGEDCEEDGTPATGYDYTVTPTAADEAPVWGTIAAITRTLAQGQLSKDMSAELTTAGTPAPTFTVAMNTGSATPSGAYSVVSGTGAFTFTPALADAGKTFTFKFTASNRAGSATQTMAVTVTAGSLTLTGSFSKFEAAAGAASLAQTVTLSGSNLGNGESVTVSVGSPFEVSLTGNDNDYASSKTVTASAAGAISSQTVYVRVASSASQGNNQTGTLQAYCTSAGGSGSAVTKSLTADVSGESTATAIERSYIVVNDGSGVEWFNGSGSGQTHSFSEYYLGEFTSLRLAAEASTRGDGSAAGHVVTMNYTVDTGTEGAWSTLTMPWKEWDDPLNKHQSHDGAGNLTYTPDLASGRAPGLYYIRVFFSQVTTGGTIYDSRNNLNYVASFRVPLTTPTISGVTSARVVSLSGKDAGATYVVVRKDSDTGWGTPSGGLPSAGATWCGGTVVYVGTDSSFTDTTAEGCAQYYYKAWTKSGSENVWSAGSASYHSPTMATPAAPVLAALSSVTYQGFTASWGSVAGATKYRVDVARSFAGTVTETFNDADLGSGTVSSYLDRTITGGVMGTWTATQCRIDQTKIDGKAPTIGAGGTLVSPALPSGCTQVSFQYAWPFSESGTVTIKLYDDDVEVGSQSISAASGGTATFTGLSIAAGSVVKFENTASSNKRILMDNITFSCSADYVAGWNNHDVGNVTSVNVTGLDELTTYYVRVKSEGSTSSCTSLWSNVQSATTLENDSVTSVTIANYDAAGEAAGSNVAAGSVAAGQTVLLQGTKLMVAAGSVTPVLTGVTFATTGTATGSDVGTLRVRVGTSSTYAGTETALGTATYTGAGTYTVSGSQSLTAGTTYYVWIEAVTAAGAAGGSTVKVSAMTTDSFAITDGRKSGSTTAAGTQTIGNLTAFAAATGATAGGQVDLTWTAGASGTLTVRWSDVSLAAIPDPGSAAEAGKEATGLTGGSYTVTGLTGCKTYYFKAWEVVGGTACGGVQTGTASASQPGAPTAPLTGTAGGAHSATLSWGAAPGAAGYSVDVWHYAGGSGGGGGGGSGGIAGTYTRITAAGQLEAGNYVIVATNKAEGLAAMRNTIGGTSTKYIECEEDVSDDKTASSLTITADNADIVWNLAYDGETETWSFRNAAWNEGAGGYAGYPGSGNSGNIYDTLDNKSRWKMGVSGGLWAVTNVGVNTRLLQYNAGSPRFACYTGGQGALMLFKQTGGGGGGSGSGTPIPDVTANVPQTVGERTRTISFPTATSASVGNLDEATTYYWSVTATGSEGCEGGSADGPSFATTELLGVPTVRAYTGLGAGQVTGTVTRASADATVLLKRYESETDADNDRNGHEVSTTPTETATLVKFDDSGLAGCKTYWYKARQTDTVDTLEGEVEATSAWSTPASAEATLGAPNVTPTGAGTSLTLDWDAVPGASYYTVLVSDTEGTWTTGSSGAAVVDEDFAGFTASADTDLSNGGGNIPSTYTDASGWYGYKVFSSNLSGNACAKLGTTKTNGFITTPGITGGLPTGGKVHFKAMRGGSEVGTLNVQICYDDGDEDDDNDVWTSLKEVTPSEEWQSYSADIPAGSTKFWICFETSAKKRTLLDDVRIVPNGGAGTIKYDATVTAPPYERTADGLTVGQTYWYMVTAWSDGGCTNATGGPATLADVPLIQVRPKEYDFGTVDKNTSVSNTFTVKNTGSQNMLISAISIDPDPQVTAYTITAIGARTGLSTMNDTTGWTLAAGESLTVTVQFKPGSDGERGARLRIRSNSYNANGEKTDPAVYGDWDVDLTGDCHDPSTEPVSVYRLEVTDGMGVMNTIADHSLALGTADGTGGELPGALQPTLSVVAWQYNGLDTSTARWSLVAPDGETVVYADRTFDSVSTVQHGGKTCTNFTARIPPVGAERAVRGAYTVLFTVNDLSGDHGVTAVDTFTPPEKGWLVEDFTRSDREATGGGALENGWIVTATDGEAGEAAIHADQLELYGPNGEMSGDPGRISVVRDMGDEEYEKHFEDMVSTVSWGFHFRTGAKTASLADGSTAGAFVLGATSDDWFGTSAAGYAVLMANDTVSLASFSGGLRDPSLAGCTVTTLTPADPSKPSAYTNGVAGKWLAVRVDFVPGQEYIADVQEAVSPKLKLYVAVAEGPGGNPLEECEEEHLVSTVPLAEFLSDNLQYAGMVWNHGYAQLSDKTGCAFDDLYFPHQKGQKEQMRFHVIDEDTDAPVIDALDLPAAVAVDKLLSGGGGLTVTGMVHDASGVWTSGSGTAPQAQLLVDGAVAWSGTPTLVADGANATLSVTIPAGAATGLSSSTVTTNCALVLTVHDRDRDRAGDSLAAVSTNWFTLCDSEPAAPAWATVEGDGAEMAVLRWARTAGTTYVVVRSDTEFGPRATPTQGTKAEPFEGTEYAGLGTVVYYGTGDNHLSGTWTAREFVVAPGSANYFAVYGMTGNGTTGYFFSEPTRPTDWSWTASDGVKYATADRTAGGMPSTPETAVRSNSWPLVTATYEPGEGVDAFAYRTSVTSPDDDDPAGKSLSFGYETRPETGSGWGGPWAGDTDKWLIHDGSLLTGDTHYPAATANKLYWQDTSWSEENEGEEWRYATSATLTRPLSGTASGDFFVAAVVHFQFHGRGKYASIALMNGNTELVSFGKQGDGQGNGDDDWSRCAAMWLNSTYRKAGTGTATVKATGGATPYDMGTDDGQDHVIVGQVSPGSKKVRLWAYGPSRSGVRIAELFTSEKAGVPTAMGQLLAELDMSDAAWPGVTAIRLQAGSDANGALGHVYFDEVRFAGTWEELFLFNAPEVYKFEFDQPEPGTGIMVGLDDEGHRQWKISDGALAHGNVGLNAQFQLFHRTGISSASFTILDEEGNQILKEAEDLAPETGGTPASVELSGTTGSAVSDWTTTSETGVPGGALGVAVPTNMISTNATYTVKVTLTSAGGKEATVTSASETGGAGSTDLFFGEYGEGRYFDKYVEIYNGTGHDVDLYHYYIFRPKSGGGNDFSTTYANLIPDSASPFARLSQTEGENILKHGETIVLLNGMERPNGTYHISGDDLDAYQERLPELQAALESREPPARYLMIQNAVLNSGGKTPYLLVKEADFNEATVSAAATAGEPVSLNWLDACGMATDIVNHPEDAYKAEDKRQKGRYIMSRKNTATYLPRSAPMIIDTNEWDYRDWSWPWACEGYENVDDFAVNPDTGKRYENFISTAGENDRNIGLGGNMEFTVFDDDEVAPVLAASGHGIDLGSGVTAPVAGTQDLLVAGWSFTNVEESAEAAVVAAPWSGSIEVSSARLTCSENLGSVERLVEKGAGKGVAGVTFNGTPQAQNGDLFFACNDAEYNITAEDDVWIGFETDMENMTERKVSFWYASGSGGFKAGHVEVSADGGTWVNPEGWTLAFDEAEGTGGAETFVLFEKSLEFTKADGTTLAIPRETEHLRFRVHLSERKSGTGTFRMDAIQVHGKPLEVVVTDAELLGKRPAFQATMSDAGSGLDLSSATFTCGVGTPSMQTRAADLVDGGRRASALRWQEPSALDKAGVQAWFEASEAEALHLRVEVKDADDDRPDDQVGMRGHFGVLRVVDDDPVAPVMASEGNGIYVDGTLSEPEEGSRDLVVAGWSFTNTASAALAMEVWSGSALTANAALSCCAQLGTVEGLVVTGPGSKGVSNVEFNGTHQDQKGELYFQCAAAGEEPDVWVGFEMDMMAMTDREVSFWYAGGSGGFKSGWVEVSADNGATWTTPDGWTLKLPTGGASTFAEFAQSLEWEEDGELAIPRNIGHLMFRVHVAEKGNVDGTFRMDCMQVHGKPSEVTVTDGDLVGQAPSFKAKVSDPGSGLDTSSLAFSYGNLAGVSTVTADTSGLVDGGRGAASVLSWAVSSALSTDEVHQWFTNSAAGDTLLKVSVKDADDDRTDDQLQLDGPIGLLQIVDDDTEPPEIVMKSMKPRSGGVLGEWFFDSKEKANQGVASLRANGLSASDLRARTGDLKPTLPHAEGSVYPGADSGYGAWQMGWHGGNKYWYVRLETLVGKTGADGARFTVTNISFNSKVNQMKGPTACMPVLLQGVASIDANDKALTWTASNRLAGASGVSLLPSGAAWTADTVNTWKSVGVPLSSPIELDGTSVNELQLWAMGAATNGSLARWAIHDLKIEGTVQYANGLSEEVTYVTDHDLANGASVGNLEGNVWDESGLSEATYKMSGWSASRPLTFTEGAMSSATTENAGAFSVEMSEIPVTYTGLLLQDYRGTVEVWDGDADRTSGDGTVNEDRLKIEGEFGFTVIDQDVVEPTAPENIAGRGVTLGTAPEYGTEAWNNAPWTNHPEFIVTFTPAEDTAPTAAQLSGDDYAAWRTDHGLEQVDAGQAAHQLVATGIGEYRVATATDAASLADAPAFSVAAVQGAIANYGFERGNKDTAAADTGWTNPDGDSGIHKGNNVGGSYPVAEGTNSYYLRAFGNGAIASQIIPFAASESAQTVTVSLSMKIFKRAEGSKLHAKFEFSADGTSWSQAHDAQLTVGTATDAHNTWLTKTLAATELTAAAGAKYLRFSVYSDGGGANIDDVRLSVRVGEAPAAGTPDTATMRYEAEQGLATKHLFAVDADNDRLGDRRTGGSVAFYTAYDGTPPTPVEMARGTGASTDDVEDPTTQMKLTWSTSGVGPDDTDHDNYKALPSDLQNGTDSLSPWKTYKVYYSAYDPALVDAALATEGESVTNYFYETFLAPDATGDGTQEEGKGRYTAWASVTADSEIEDSTATTGYSGMSNVATPSVTVYDLENDLEYVFVTVGVDKAGNEGPATTTSWATNNTIKFAMTQGVVRASTVINDMLPTDATELANVGMKRIDTAAKPRGAVLYWKAAGLNERLEGVVKKDYDLIFRDAGSFRETGRETWNPATSGENSGTSKTNWNYQTDGLEGISRRKLRFYRASYHNRWQDAVTNAGTVKKQTPLASEDVYSMGRVGLLAGQNLVGLQGLPWTNTMAGAFGTDWPASTRASESTRVEFFGADGHSDTGELYWLCSDGKWMKGSDDYSTIELPASFFARGFSITLPDELPQQYQQFTNTVNGNPVCGMWWHPMMQVPTNAPMAWNPHLEGWMERSGESGNFTYTLSEDTEVDSSKLYYHANGKAVQKTKFSVEVTYGGRTNNVPEPRFTLVNLNLPVAVNVADLGLVQTNADGTWKGGILPGNGTTLGDVIYTYDNEHKKVRDNSLMYYSISENKWKNSYGTGLTFYPNDAIIIKSQGERSAGPTTNSTWPAKDSKWIWTYSPEDFYEPPTRHMGRERIGE